MLLKKVTVDISVYLNSPSRQGFKYVLLLTDVVTKMIWKYRLKTRSGDEVFNYIRNWVNCVLPSYPGKHQVMHYHADSKAELIDQRIKSFLLKAFGTKVTWSSTDTTELNAMSERKFHALGK